MPTRPFRACSPAGAEASAQADSVELSGENVKPFWGVKGHQLVHRVGIEELPDEVPGFLKEAADRVVAMATRPDRWKMRELPHLRNSVRPEHYVSLERLDGRELPDNRYAYITMLDREQLVPEGEPQWNGTLPYAIAELYQQLVAEFAFWRGAGGAEKHQAAENVIYTAGVLGHYLGDATQPLHTTVHHDGWDERAQANPEGFRTRRGLHSEFETRLVNRVVDETAVRERLRPPAPVSGDPLEWASGLLQESHELVDDLYRLEKQGKLTGSDTEGNTFVTDRVARGAEVFRDVLYGAWLESARVAPEHGELGFLMVN